MGFFITVTRICSLERQAIEKNNHVTKLVGKDISNEDLINYRLGVCSIYTRLVLYSTLQELKFTTAKTPPCIEIMVLGSCAIESEAFFGPHAEDQCCSVLSFCYL
jgi:hypothetical protein